MPEEKTEVKKKLLLLEYNGAANYIRKIFGEEYEIITTRFPIAFFIKIINEKPDVVVVDYFNPLVTPKFLKEKLDEILGPDNYYVLAYNKENARKKFCTEKIIEYYKCEEVVNA